MDAERTTERFYDVRTKLLLRIPRSKVEKFVFTDHHNKKRYGLKGTTIDNRVLTKFVEKAYWDTL